MLTKSPPHDPKLHSMTCDSAGISWPSHMLRWWNCRLQHLALDQKSLAAEECQWPPAPVADRPNNAQSDDPKQLHGPEPTSDGLQPTSDGLQPTSDGLQPTSDGLQPNGDGLQPTGDGLQPASEPTSDGLLQPNIVAMASNLLSWPLTVTYWRWPPTY